MTKNVTKVLIHSPCPPWDKEIVLAAVQQNHKALGFASKKLQKDRDVVLFAMKVSGMNLQDLWASLQEQKEQYGTLPWSFATDQF